jgi:hypothetical protein
MVINPKDHPEDNRVGAFYVNSGAQPTFLSED